MTVSSSRKPQWSLLGAIARIRGPHRGLQFGSLGNPRPIETVLPPAQDADLRVCLAPVLDRLNAARRDGFRRAESDLRLKAGGAALAGLVLGWTMGGPLFALALIAGGALFAILLLAGQANSGPRDAAKHAILNEMAPVLHGLASVAPEARAAALPVAWVDGWRLFGPIHLVTVDDRLIGERDGWQVAVSRVGFQFGNRANKVAEAGAGLCFVVVEIMAPDAPEDRSDQITVIVPQDAPAQLRNTPHLTHGLREAATGDADFDAAYRVYGNPVPLEAAARTSFSALQSVTRANRSATLEVPAGTGLRPSVVIRPGRLVVLTPLALFDGALEPPPLWEPLDADRLVPAFASDLAILNDHVTAALTLMKGLFR